MKIQSLHSTPLNIIEQAGNVLYCTGARIVGQAGDMGPILLKDVFLKLR